MSLAHIALAYQQACFVITQWEMTLSCASPEKYQAVLGGLSLKDNFQVGQGHYFLFI